MAKLNEVYTALKSGCGETVSNEIAIGLRPRISDYVCNVYVVCVTNFLRKAPVRLYENDHKN